jgi:hypothetical protein
MTIRRSNRKVVSVRREPVVCSPTDRRQLLTAPRDERLTTILDEQFGSHRLVKRLKGDSSHALHALREALPAVQRRRPSRWTNRSSCATTGGVTRETLKRYVRYVRYRQNQKGH